MQTIPLAVLQSQLVARRPACRSCGVPTPKVELDRRGECPACRAYDGRRAKEDDERSKQ